MGTLTLSSPITDIRMINEGYAQKLIKLGIFTVQDLLFHIPFRYEDYTKIATIGDLDPHEKVTIIGIITHMKNVYTKYGKPMQRATISDGSRHMDCIWYNQTYIEHVLTPGKKVALAGDVSFFDRKLTLQSPEYELVTDAPLLHTGRLVPVYPETRGISSKWLRGKIYTLLPLIQHSFPDPLSDEYLKTYEVYSFSDALMAVHFPRNLTDAEKGKHRLAFDELLVRHIASLMRKRKWQTQTSGYIFHVTQYQKQIDTLIKSLPFDLTDAQKKATDDIFKDVSLKTPMNRLLVGDVGSGKTIVAAIQMYLAYINGCSSVLMAPTEILAQQHFSSISSVLSSYNIPIYSITGNTKSSHPSEYKVGIYIGTHALLEERVDIPSLGLVIIDEQQRFGVEQRAKLREKGNHPHTLSMTATPIPRTIALTIYNDLDLSILDQMPQGRKRIKTWVVPKEKRHAAYNWIKTNVIDGTGQQAFIICPLIEESESMASVKSAKKEFEILSKDVFPDLSLGIVHGKMKPKEKDEVLNAFREGKYQILVATPVVEVGIDIPQATIILIEASDRFGLSQLHQLRGRVGRSSRQSYCLLFTETESQKTIQKLKLLETIHIGPLLAEEDLRLRGSGDMYGTKQHGSLTLKFSDFSDRALLQKTKEAARLIVSKDPTLKNLPLLRELVIPYTIRSISKD